MKGLAPGAERIFETISNLECIKPFVLVGGTGLSLQINKRLSEDLDFMRWKTGSQDKLEIGISTIKRELNKTGLLEDVDILGFDQAIFMVEGVKVSFYAALRRKLEEMREIPLLNNLRVADIKSIGAMKMETMSRRNTFRDYYDVYSILREGVSLSEMVAMAVKHSEYHLKEKNLLSILSSGQRFIKDSRFMALNPVYDVTSSEIQAYINREIEKKRLHDIIANIDGEIARTATTIKTKEGETMIRSTISGEIFTYRLSKEENLEILHDRERIKALAVSHLHDMALTRFEEKRKDDAES